MTVISYPSCVPVAELTKKQKATLPQLYYFAWKQNGLCDDTEEAQKVLQFDPHHSYALLDEKSHGVYGLLNTLPLSIPPEHIHRHYPTYSSVEHASKARTQPENIRTVLCFSIISAPDMKVKRNEKLISCARYMIESIKEIYLQGIIAVYTRLSGVPEGMSATEYYKQNKDTLQDLGSVGMHAHLGASLPPIAIIENARPEDTDGGGANVVMTYPRKKTSPYPLDF